MGGAEIVVVELFGERHVELADEAGGTDRESLQRILHLHRQPEGDGRAVDRLANAAHAELFPFQFA
jgi:hypothetical protein